MNSILRKVPVIHAFKRLSSEERTRVQDRIQDLARADSDYFILTITSGLIITLGLIINSEATVIGGMLISPLIWPIMALALAMMEGKKRLLTTSLYTLLRSFIIVFVIGIPFGWLVPLSEFGSVINGLVEPTIFDLLIAVIAGLGGAYSAVYSKNQEAMSALFGVAVATVLVPPMSVAGIMLGKFALSQAFGAFLLFIVNLLSALLTASLIFLIGHFSHVSSKRGEVRRKTALTWAVIIFIVILIPVSIFSWKTIGNEARKEDVYTIFSEILPEFSISELVITKEQSSYMVSGTLYVNEKFSKKNLELVSDKLRDDFNKPVTLQLHIIPYSEEYIYSD